MAETFVVDCSVAAKWVLPDPSDQRAWEFYDRYESGEITLIAPDLVLSELASLLSRRCRQKDITAAQALLAYRLFTQSAPKLVPATPFLLLALSSIPAR